MNALRSSILFIGLILASAAGADEQPARILVTFADPGMSNAARAGPVRPGYNRRSSTYLVSIDVRRAARRVESEFGLRQLDEWPINPLKVHCIVYAVDDAADIDGLLARLRQHSRVESAQRMNTFDVLGPERRTGDAFAPLLDNMARLELAAAHRWTRGRGSGVAIIDTGADIEHPNLRSQIAEHADFVSEDSAGFSADAHGTAVAGVIGAAGANDPGIVGVAPAASLSILKACWYPDGNAGAICDSFTLARALSFAIDSRAQIINLSLGGPEDPLLTRLVQRALSAGKTVVAAAGHEAAPFPASIDGVIAVSDADGQLASIHGVLFAPGRDILVPTPGGGFDVASGNSLSAAHVSGVAALLVSRRPALQHEDIRALLSTGSPEDSISACRALAALLSETGCNDAIRAADDRL